MSEDLIFQRLTNVVSQDKIGETLAEVLRELTGMIGNITEYSESELKAISLLQTDRYISNLLGFYVSNKKHKKRKFAEELMEFFKHLTNTLGNRNNFPSMEERGR